MPSTSSKQQRFMRAVLAAKKKRDCHMSGAKVGKACKSMNERQIREFLGKVKTKR